MFAHLQLQYESWFGAGFEFLLYDVTSNFFEGHADANPKAGRGYRRDCTQVCIGLVVSAEGLPLAYEAFAGNRADVTTVEPIVTCCEAKHGRVLHEAATVRSLDVVLSSYAPPGITANASRISFTNCSGSLAARPTKRPSTPE